MVNKRGSGRLKGSDWLVLTESTQQGEDFVHQCGTTILGKDIVLSNRDGVGYFSGDGKAKHETVPFCPNCEREPQRGSYGKGGVNIIS